MPRQDGAGPMGAGPGTGWGTGPCGAGYGWRRSGGMGRSMGRMMSGWFNRPRNVDDEKAVLENEEKWLEQELEAVRKERKALKYQK